MKNLVIQKLPIAVLLFLILCAETAGGSWRSLGPFGGDVRSLAQDPKNPFHLYLGTSDSQIFFSTTGGTHWERLSSISARSDFVVDHILVDPTDPKRIYVGTWSIASNAEGGVLLSTDAGHTWKDLPGIHGQSVRALAMAPSDQHILVAGTLEGVFSSQDGGEHWSQISPPHHEEIRNVESIAIDPRNPRVIYAGTWHLPWKTVDGGQNWTHIQRGIVEDSDVFAIFIQPTIPDHVLLSACTGIYQSADGGSLWAKFKGIPSSSRRTRAIVADPSNPLSVYAGTTEGFWRSLDGGVTWNQMTSRTLTVNAIVVDSSNHNRLLLGTDDAGVLVSTDSGTHFTPINDGFTNRAVSSIVFDPQSPQRIYLGVLYDHEFGGVFVSEDSGATWRTINHGLGSTDVHVLYLSPEDNSLWAGTADGAFLYDRARNEWRRMDINVSMAEQSSVPKIISARPAHSLPPRRNIKPASLPGMGTVSSLSGESAYGHYFYAASQRGLFATRDSGQKWVRVNAPFKDSAGIGVLTLDDGRVFYGTDKGLAVSTDEGVHWKVVDFEDGPTPIHCIRAVPQKSQVLLVATGNGLFRSEDGGNSWSRAQGGLPRSEMSDIQIDARQGTEIYVSESYFGSLYRSTNLGKTWEWMSPFPGAGMKYRSLLPDPQSPNRFFVLFFREGLYGAEGPVSSDARIESTAQTPTQTHVQKQ